MNINTYYRYQLSLIADMYEYCGDSHSDLGGFGRTFVEHLSDNLVGHLSV
jgi:hypothetical protein